MTSASNPKPGVIVAPAPPSETHGDQCSNGNAAIAQVKKSVWNVPSNGSTELGAIMGASNWPALSKSTASPKSSSSKPLSEGSVSTPTGLLDSSPSSKPIMSSRNPDSSRNRTAPARQKSIKRYGSSVGSSNTLTNGVPALPLPPPVLVQSPEITTDKHAFPQPSPKGLPNNNSSDRGFQPQPHGGNDYSRSYGGNRRGNNGGGAGPHHNNYGNRRDPERGGYEWNHRNFGSRNVHMPPPPPPLTMPSPPPPLTMPPPPPPPRGMLPYLKLPSPVPSPFIVPSPQGPPFAPQMGYPGVPSPMYYNAAPPPPEALRGVSFVSHPPFPPMFFPMIDHESAELLKQIEYYFSPENLCHDTYLRKNMDTQGWVSIMLIAGFNKVKKLTSNIQYILDTVRLSTTLEVQGEKIRRRNNWMNWVLPPARNDLSQSPATPSSDTPADSLQTVELEGATDQNNTSEPASGNLSSK